MRLPAEAIEPMAVDVASVKKFHSTIANNSCTSNSGVPAPALSNRAKTAYMMPKSINGLTSDQMYPSADPVYFNLNCVTASSRARLKFRRHALRGRGIASRRGRGRATALTIGAL